MIKDSYFSRYTSATVVAFMLILQGCGGGGTSTESNVITPPDSNNNSNPSSPIINESSFKYNRISIAGSSITHGNIENASNDGEGYVGEKSYVGVVEKYFREEVANTMGPDQLIDADGEIAEPMSYEGVLKVYNARTELTGQLDTSDEITIVYAGTGEHTVVELEVDGVKHEYTIPDGTYTPEKKVFDDSNVDFYKAFRQTNEKAVKTWKLSTNKPHSFTLRVKEGTLHLNFITNHMYYMQNAGVGGFEALDFLNDTRQHSTVEDIIAFKPDLFLFESSTNDAKTWIGESNPNEAPSANVWRVENPIDFTSNGKQIILNQNIQVKKGDVVIMGEYEGDIQNMFIGIVANNTNSNVISLSKIVSYEGKRVTEINELPEGIQKCRIKDITMWEDRVKEVIREVKAGVTHQVTIGIGTSGVPNYYDPQVSNNTPRRLLGYREKGEILAQENDWLFIDFFQEILNVEAGVDTDHKWTYGDNTHPNENGRNLFGKAVIEALQ